jgi:hypothetical protein
MSKKIKNVAIVATNEPEVKKVLRVVNGEDLKDLMIKFPNVSIRKLAQTAEITYGMLLKASKAPIVGQQYDPEAINYDALANEFCKRKKSFLEDALDWPAMDEGRASRVGTLVKDMAAFEIGMKVYLRRNNEIPYEIVYKTDSHIVIMLAGTSEPQSWGHDTFLMNGPVFTPRATTTTTKVETAEA